MRIARNMLAWMVNFPVISQLIDRNRWRLLRGMGIRVSESFIRRPFSFYGPAQSITIGHSCFINADLWIEVGKNGPIKIGNFCAIGPSVRILSTGHRLDFDERHDVIARPIVIEDKCWLGAGAIILGNVTIGEGSVVAAGAVVNRNVESYTLVGGVPARLIKRLEKGVV